LQFGALANEAASARLIAGDEVFVEFVSSLETCLLGAGDSINSSPSLEAALNISHRMRL
jgi:hypothetical protein